MVGGRERRRDQAKMEVLEELKCVVKDLQAENDAMEKMRVAASNQWAITKVFTIAVDNASANDVVMQYMKRRLRGYKTLMFDGEYLHLRCACHTINLVVKGGLKELENGIAAIRNSAKYVRSSSARLDKIREFAILEQCRANANVPLDVITRWNKTFLMLQAALKYPDVVEVSYRQA